MVDRTRTHQTGCQGVFTGRVTAPQMGASGGDQIDGVGAPITERPRLARVQPGVLWREMDASTQQPALVVPGVRSPIPASPGSPSVTASDEWGAVAA
jgi:hypothetical protein